MISSVIQVRNLAWCHWLLMAVPGQFQQGVSLCCGNTNSNQNTAHKTSTVSVSFPPTIHTVCTCEYLMSSSVLATNVFRFGKLLFPALFSISSYWVLWNEPFIYGNYHYSNRLDGCVEGPRWGDWDSRWCAPSACGVLVYLWCMAKIGAVTCPPQNTSAFPYQL
jgi:hypothetical protein